MLFVKYFVLFAVFLSSAHSQTCFCDLTQNECDVNCCCDPNCSSNSTAVFSFCINTNNNLSNLQCSYSVESYVNGILISTDVQQTGLFCLVQDNFPNRNFFVDASCITSSTCTDTSAFVFSDSFNSLLTTSVYQTGDPIFVAFDSTSNSGVFTTPSSGISSSCQDYVPVDFLVSRKNDCTRSLSANNLMSACGSFLNYRSYSDGLQVYSVPLDTSSTMNISVSSCVVNGITGSCIDSNFINNVCEFAVTSVSYVFLVNSNYNRILSASVSFVLQDISSVSDFFLTQTFGVNFELSSQNVVDRAGNPGYVVGKPLLAAVRQSSLQNILQYRTLGIELSLINPNGDGTCESAQRLNRLPLLFGQDIRTGCTLTVDSSMCSILLKNRIKGILDRPNFDAFNGASTIFVGTYGNSNISNLIAALPADWVPVLIDSIPNQSPVFSQGGCSNLIVSSKYEILFANAGSTSNPQAKIVGIKYSYDVSSFLRFTCSNGTCTQTVDISTSVRFVDISSNPVSIERNRPVIDARLPADFYYPLRN